MRVIVDTNLFISHLLFPREPDRSAYRLVRTLLERQVTHVLIIELLQELEGAVSASTYLSQRITPDDVRRFREALLTVSEVVSLVGTPILPILRDPKDDYLLTASWKFAVDVLITGDRDLIDVRHRIGPPRIMTLAEFLALDQL